MELEPTQICLQIAPASYDSGKNHCTSPGNSFSNMGNHPPCGLWQQTKCLRHSWHSANVSFHPSPSHAFPGETLSPLEAGPGSGGGCRPLLGTIPSCHWHSGARVYHRKPCRTVESWGPLSAHSWGMLEHLEIPHPSGHPLRYSRVSGVGPAWAQLGASWRVLGVSWDPHHECWGAHRVSTLKDTRAQ